MPSPRDIELFRTQLLKLAKEEAILAERGEKPHVMEPPPEPGPLSVDQPLQGGKSDAQPNPEMTETGDFSALLDGLDLDTPVESTSNDDISDFLDDIGEEPRSSETLPPESGTVSESKPDTAAEGDLDSFLASDFLSSGNEAEELEPEPLDSVDESISPEPLEEIGEPEPMEEIGKAEPIDETSSIDEPTADSFGLSDFDLPADLTASTEDTSFSMPDMQNPEPVDSSLTSNIDFESLGETPLPESKNELDLVEESLAFETPEGTFNESAGIPGTGEQSAFGLPESDLNFSGSKLDASSEDAFADFSLDDDFSKKFEPEGFSEQAIDDQLSVLEGTAEESPEGFNLQNAISDDISFADFAEPGAHPEKSDRPETPAGKAGKKSGKSKPPKKGAEAVPELEGPIELTEAETERLQDHLFSYPLNLRLAVEEIIAERPLEEKQLKRIIRMLVDGAKPEEMARVAGKIIDKRIEIPKGFHKKTAEEFEREKASFTYAFVHNILPIIRTVALVIAVVGFLGFLGWKFIYIPLKADSLYRAGYSDIGKEKYPEAEELFDQAWETQPVKDWFYRYAEAYVLKKNYPWAEQKYEKLLKRFPRDKKGAMDYARLENSIFKFEKAEEIVQTQVLEKNQWDNDGILFQGDNRLAWGDNLTDSADFTDTMANESEKHRAEAAERYEGARLSFARLIQRYGLKDQYRARMTRYFVRTDNRKEAIANKDYWLASKKADIDALTLTELCGWLIGNMLIEDIKPLLIKAQVMEDTLPEVHYEFTRYFQAANEPDEELKSLRNAEKMFGYAETKTGLRLSGRRLAKFMDTMKWYGEALIKQGNNLEAEPKFTAGIARYERALNDHMLKPDNTGRFGKLYADRGDIQYYFRDDLPLALKSFNEAERNGYVTKDTNYKRGYIYYRMATSTEVKDESFLVSALLRFKDASTDFRENERLKYALANTVYLRGDYHLAHGYYLELVNDLKSQLFKLAIVEAQTNPRHNELVVRLMKVTNNLGITLVKLGRKAGNTLQRSQGMVALTESSQMFDALSRDQGTMLRTESKNLAYLNMNGILYPIPRSPDGRFVSNNGIFDPSIGFDLQIYLDIDKKPEGEPGEAGIQAPSPLR